AWMIENNRKCRGPARDAFVHERDLVAIANRWRDRVLGDLRELARLRGDTIDREKAREIGRVLREGPVLDVNGDRGYHCSSARIRLVESGRVNGGGRGANAEGAPAIAERVGGEKCGDRSRTIDLATKRRLRDLETRRPEAKLARDRCAIGVASGRCHPAIERIPLGVHRERNVRLATHRVDPRAETIDDASGLRVRDRRGYGCVDVWC